MNKIFTMKKKKKKKKDESTVIRTKFTPRFLFNHNPIFMLGKASTVGYKKVKQTRLPPPPRKEKCGFISRTSGKKRLARKQAEKFGVFFTACVFVLIRDSV